MRKACDLGRHRHKVRLVAGHHRHIA